MGPYSTCQGEMVLWVNKAQMICEIVEMIRLGWEEEEASSPVNSCGNKRVHRFMWTQDADSEWIISELSVIWLLRCTAKAQPVRAWQIASVPLSSSAEPLRNVWVESQEEL